MAFDAFSARYFSFETSDFSSEASLFDGTAQISAYGPLSNDWIGTIGGAGFGLLVGGGDRDIYEPQPIEKIGGTLDPNAIISTPEADIAGDVTTTATIAIGGSFTDQIEVSGDTDWVKIDLVAGTKYVFTLDGTGADILDDPYLELMGTNGLQVAFNDDGGPGLNSRLAFIASTSGTYYLNAHGWVDSAGATSTGAYTLTAAVAPPLDNYTIDQAANFVTDQFSTRSSYSVTNITYNIDAISAGAQILAERAFQQWADISALTFTRVTGATSALITFQDTEDGAYNSNTTTTVGGVRTITGGTVNVTSDWFGGSTAWDSYTYQTYLHEIGHALGLGHAGPYNGSADYGLDAIYDIDSWAYSVMSYFDQAESGYGDYRFVLGPQMVDVLAIQDLYGANPGGTRTGNTTYGFNSTEADANNFGNFTRPPSLTIYDTGGTDTLDVSGYSSAQYISLVPETFSDLGNRGSANYNNVISIMRGTIIENAVGGTGNDTLIGNDVANDLSGGLGDDILEGGAGNDTLTGGIGADTFVLKSGFGADTVSDFSVASGDLVDLRSYSAAAAQTAINGRTSVNGGTMITIGADSIFLAGVASGTITAASFLTGTTANLSPIAVSDTAIVVESATVAINVFADNGSGADSDPEGDGFAVTALNGSSYSNGTIVTLSSGATVTFASDGNLQYNTNGAFDGLQTGQTGSDSFTYTIDDGNGGAPSTATVTVTISGETPTAGAIQGTPNNDNLPGTSGDDTIIGLAGADILNGYDGNDILIGGDGNDVLRGGNGDDVQVGGDGLDVLHGSLGADELDGGAGFDWAYYLFSNAGVTVDLTAGTGAGGWAAGDTLTGIERVDGSNLNDTITGDGANNTLYGWNGDDTINGGAGNDRLFGVNGNDTVNGGAGADYITTGIGDDIVNGGDDNDLIYGQQGNDILFGGAAQDVIVGGSGTDTLSGDDGNDYLYGGTGNDTLNGGAGFDRVLGQDGNDTLYGGSGYDVMHGGNGDDTLYGEAGTGVLYGNAGNDYVYGGDNNDYIYGGTGADHIFAGAGVDILRGEDGDDFVHSGAGVNYMRGNAGNDTFIHNAGDGVDVIYDFTQGADLIRLVGTQFTDFTSVQNAMTDFAGFTILTIGTGENIRLIGYQKADFTSADFSFVTAAEDASGNTSKSEFVVSEVQTLEGVDAGLASVNTAILGTEPGPLAIMSDDAFGIQWNNGLFGFLTASISDVAPSGFDFSQLDVADTVDLNARLQDFLIEQSLIDAPYVSEAVSLTYDDAAAFDFDQYDDEFTDAISHIGDADWQIA